jgi:hypothetical protein
MIGKEKWRARGRGFILCSFDVDTRQPNEAVAPGFAICSGGGQPNAASSIGSFTAAERQGHCRFLPLLFSTTATSVPHSIRSQQQQACLVCCLPHPFLPLAHFAMWPKMSVPPAVAKPAAGCCQPRTDYLSDVLLLVVFFMVDSTPNGEAGPNGRTAEILGGVRERKGTNGGSLLVEDVKKWK